MQVPNQISKCSVVAYVSIPGSDQILDTTTIEVAGAKCGPAKYLAVYIDEEESGFYLFFCDGDWNVWNDLWFYSIDETKHFTESYEYSGTLNTWRDRTR